MANAKPEDKRITTIIKDLTAKTERSFISSVNNKKRRAFRSPEFGAADRICKERKRRNSDCSGFVSLHSGRYFMPAIASPIRSPYPRDKRKRWAVYSSFHGAADRI